MTGAVHLGEGGGNQCICKMKAWAVLLLLSIQGIVVTFQSLKLQPYFQIYVIQSDEDAGEDILRGYCGFNCLSLYH